MNKTVLLSGGGLDSAAYITFMTLCEIKFDIIVADYGQKAFVGEYKATKRFSNNVTHISIPHIKKEGMLFSGDINEDPFVEGRNYYLINQVLPQYDNIFLGFTDPGYTPMSDASTNFIKSFNKVLSASFNNKRIFAPLITIDRSIAILGAYYLDPQLFNKAMTCWIPAYETDSVIQCGECKHCLLQKRLLEINKLWTENLKKQHVALLTDIFTDVSRRLS